MKVSVVVPCYGSEQTLGELTERLILSLSRAVVAELEPIEEFEVLLVVDGSPDAVSDVARDAAIRHPQVKAIELRRNFGQHNALVAGIRMAAFDVVVTLDDDLQHPPEEIGRLLEPLLDSRVDLVYGIPEQEEHGFARSAASRLVKTGLVAAGVQNASLVGAFRAFRTHLRDGFERVTDPSVNLDVLLSWSTTAVVGQSLRMDKRTSGRSSYTWGRLIGHALNMITGYGVLPLKLASLLGFACGIVGVVLLVVVLVRFATGETTVAGFTTLAALVALFSGAQLVSIGIIGEYIGRQHFRSMQRPMYLVRSDSRDAAGEASGIA